MALYIRDAEVDSLAAEIQKLTNAPTKTEAVRQALKHELARARKELPLRERFARAKAMADALGPNDPNFDMKAFTDEMWGDA
ncbi:type II toxin-antitoxin system VapB family antitoxin [Rhizobium mayense]|uniref:Type II toxin-antitoxin system VapB family antitoxin n=1 Tax=Rhizobium mayense TaxID=1312184 RepID=A0ABT7JM40_9HYPH|nr:type II toxin-antitoxin system VapB family antitoxin [Rhizobium mayense]MDL2397411.1 type II toxin-antitoxin system VapB family antitoxin [Rhizobium mayense]